MPTEANFFEKLDEVSSLASHDPPSQLATEKIIEILRDGDVRREFLGTTDDPRWITALRDAGFFNVPPEPQRTDGGIRYPSWAESQYLARVARRAPGDVATLFRELNTDNASIIGDMVDAALVMSPEDAASLVPQICHAAKEGMLFIGFDRASDLCVHLAQEGWNDEAMRLAEALFSPRFVEGQEQPNRRDVYWYKEGMAKVVPVLASRDSHVFLPKVCDWLKASIEAKGHVDFDTGSDLSCMWRPAIEEHEQNRDYDFAGVMVGFVREGFEVAIRDDCLSLADAMDIIEKHPYLVYKRIRLHLIGEFSDRNPDLARRTLLSKELFDDYEYKHEYAVFAGRALPLLSPEEQARWFSWIDDGPDMSGFDEEDRRARIEYWQFQKLHWVRDHLEGERREFYDRMRAERGEPEMADLNFRMDSGWSGDESPYSVEQLSAVSIREAVDMVASWRPEEPSFTGPNISGLGSTFEQYVATNPEGFSAEAEVLMDRPAIYVRGFIDQMNQAVRAGKVIDLDPVLNLCDWVVRQPVGERTTPHQRFDDLVDDNWQWTRDEISRFLGTVCRASEYPVEQFRKRMWGTIESLCRDRPESYVIRDRSHEDPRVHDYLTFAINSPRGKAVEAALDYARWVADHFKQSDEGREFVPGGFDAMPEVRAVLEDQIAPGNRSFEGLSVIGSHIGLIHSIDQEWVETHTDQIFSLVDIEQDPSVAHGWAAWNGFLVWVRPHGELYRMFKSQYAYGVQQASVVELPERTYEQPMHHLGEHLMLLYGRGRLELDDDDGLLTQFIENARPEIRCHAIRFVGNVLERDQNVPLEVIERFMALWDFYWAGPGRKDAAEHQEQWLFGTWFASGRFPEQWAIDRLEEFVQVNPTPEPDHDIGERLAEMSHADIAKSVRILDRMVRGDREGWRLGGYHASAHQLLGQALQGPGEARETALKLIDYLARRGYGEFGELLKQFPASE